MNSRTYTIMIFFLLCLSGFAQNQVTGDFTVLEKVEGGTTPRGEDYTYATNADNTITITKHVGTNAMVNIPSTINGMSVTSIRDDAFWECPMAGCRHVITSITIPDSVITIETAAFCYCYSLTSVTIGNGITSIGRLAFVHCTSLTNVYFRGNAPSISAGPAFVGTSLPFDGSPNAIIYYLPGTTGWGTNFAGRPTKEWKP